jgi:hypothetical protein
MRIAPDESGRARDRLARLERTASRRQERVMRFTVDDVDAFLERNRTERPAVR